MDTTIIQVKSTGGPEVLEPTSTQVPAPGPGQLRVVQRAVGVNFIDVYQRTGLYPLPLPFVAGQESVGVVESVGPQVRGFSPGDRVATAAGPGAYASVRLFSAERTVAVPPAVDDETAAAVLLKGMTARYLLKATARVQPGQVAVVHAAAGATGQLLVQWAVHLGLTVVAVVGSPAKAALVRSLGAQHVAVRGQDELAQVVAGASEGQGAHVVFDSVGRDTFASSLACLRTRGLLVLFGQASGVVPPLDVSLLARKALFLTRPGLAQYTETREELEETAADVFQAVAQGVLKPTIDARFPLAQAADAHRRLEARASAGALLLLP